jgi:8-oxo-dGTP diphosphatase
MNETESICCQCGTRLVEQRVGGRLRLVCPRCGFVLYRRLKVGAGALVQREGRLLLVQRGQECAFSGAWSLPAGYCEVDEPPSIAAAREVAEETGLRVRIGRLVNVYFFDDDPRGNGLLIVYEGAIADGQLRVDGREAAVAAFFSPRRLPEPLCGGGHDRAIKAWQARALHRWRPGAPMRYCPHCMHPLEEQMAYGRLRPACPACGFVFFRELKVGVSLIVEEDGRLLLVRRAIEPGLDKWSLPSGFVDWDETPEDAAVRECAEETGLKVEVVEFLGLTHYKSDFRGPGINLTYRGQVTGGVLGSGDDVSDALFFAASEVPAAEAIAFHSHVEALERWRATAAGGNP